MIYSNMTSTRGGHRIPGPGKHLGRTPSKLIRMIRVFRATEAEAKIIDGMTPEQRTEACVEWSRTHTAERKEK